MSQIFEDCGLRVPFKKMLPKKPRNYPFSSAIEEFFGAGNYMGYETNLVGANLLTQVTAYKFVHKNKKFVEGLVTELKDYIRAWKECIKHHEDRKGTTCYNPSFRAMLHSGINEITEVLNTKIPKLLHGLDDFETAVEFVEIWNEIQHTMMVTYYANLIAFPDFLKHEKCFWDDELTCAMCNLQDREILHPTPNFLFLSGFFTPEDFLLPSKLWVAQGVYVHEKADEKEILHEHVHGYIHQCRNASEQILCDYLDEGFAEWCTISLKKPENVVKGIFREKYDFWIVFNSLPRDVVLNLFKLYLSASAKVNWQAFVSEGVKCIIQHREKNRHRRFWAPNEQLSSEHVEKLLSLLELSVDSIGKNMHLTSDMP